MSDPSTVSTESCRQGGSASRCQTRKYVYYYHPDGLLYETMRDPYGDAQHQAFSRKANGNIWKIVEDVSTGEDARTTIIDYDTEDIFPFRINRDVDTTHSLDTYALFDRRSGALALAVDPNGVVSGAAYDDFGLRRFPKTPKAFVGRSDCFRKTRERPTRDPALGLW